METVSWLRFQPDQDAKILYVDILVGRLIELQPNTSEETDVFCQDLYPVLDQIQAVCLEHGFKQVCSANLEGIRVRNIKPMIMMRMIWNVYEHTKNCILLQGCEVSGGGPPFMRNMIKLIPSRNDSDDSEGDSSDLVPGLEQASDEI